MEQARKDNGIKKVAYIHHWYKATRKDNDSKTCHSSTSLQWQRNNRIEDGEFKLQLPGGKGW